MYSMYVLYKIKKHIFTSKLFGFIKTLKTKKVFENVLIFFLYSVQCTVYMVRKSAEFLTDRRIYPALLKISKNERRSTVASALKG
jgi:hypothetical protein